MPKPITPEQLARNDSEHGHQCAIFCYANQSGIEELKWLFAIPNQTVGARRGSRMVAEGLKSGVPDMMLPVARRGYLGMFIELKVLSNRTGKSTTTSEEQNKWLEQLQVNGYYVCVCVGWEAAVEKLRWYLNV